MLCFYYFSGFSEFVKIERLYLIYQLEVGETLKFGNNQTYSSVRPNRSCHEVHHAAVILLVQVCPKGNDAKHCTV